jgi:hypothetical protein
MDIRARDFALQLLSAGDIYFNGYWMWEGSGYFPGIANPGLLDSPNFFYNIFYQEIFENVIYGFK